MPDGSDADRGSDYEGLRKRAKSWLKALRSGDGAARVRLDRVLPQHSEPPRLREVQQALAREQGFASWAELKEQLLLSVGASASSDGAALIDSFLEHACIFTAPQDLPVKWRRAGRILALNPALATASIHTAVLCGEVGHVRDLLRAEPGLLNEPGGPQRWEPLLFACYGRLPTQRAAEHGLEIARLLLDAGADPNSRFVSGDDWKLRFTALTGAMGQGEMSQPEHPHADAVARLLLERGADPNDGQGLYNTHLVGDDTRWLELLLGHGLGPGDAINWHDDPAAARLSGADKCPAILDYLVAGAAANGHQKRLKLLLEVGANPDARSIYDDKSCYQHALLAGSREAADLLQRFGAEVIGLDGHDAFVAAARSGERSEAERLLKGHPESLEIADPLTEAAAQGQRDVVALLLELGVDPNGLSRHGHRALNNACQDRPIAELLLAHGADPRARSFGGTACGWARHAGDLPMARFHAEHSRSLLDAATSGHRTLVEDLLEAEPDCVDERRPDGNGPLHELALDIELAEPIVVALLAQGADPELANEAGETPAERLEALGADEVADLLETLRNEAR